MSLLDQAIARALPAVPKPVVQLFSQRYIAGSTLADAVRVVRRLNAEGKVSTVDVLGEEITREDEARAIAQAYRDVFAAIERERLDSNVSVKLTALGLDLDYDLCKANLRSVVSQGKFVRIDMEDSSTTDDTLRLYRELLDLTGGFGVAALGHRNPRILAAWAEQPVVHALGDLAGAEVTARLREALPWPAKLGVTGEDAVEIGLRTASLATRRAGIAAFEGAYHGTGLLALAAGDFPHFKAPWRAWLPGPVHRYPYGEDPGRLPADTACVIVEPVQGRAGSRVPPPDFLEGLRARCDEVGALLVVDAIYAGIGRIGELWPGADVADVLCVGKALGGGIPLSAALFLRDGLAELWELGPEDVYTHTHVGNPLACAAALVVLDEVPALLPRVGELGARFEAAGWWGKGLLRARAGSADAALERGVLVVPAADGGLIQATPPLTLSDDELDEALARLA